MIVAREKWLKRETEMQTTIDYQPKRTMEMPKPRMGIAGVMFWLSVFTAWAICFVLPMYWMVTDYVKYVH